MIITHDEANSTVSIQYDDADSIIYNDQFDGGIAEAIESLLTQNRRQRRDQIFDKLIKNSQGPVSYASKDDFVMSELSKPGYENAKERREKSNG